MSLVPSKLRNFVAAGLLIGATVAAQPWSAEAAPGDDAIVVPG